MRDPQLSPEEFRRDEIVTTETILGPEDLVRIEGAVREGSAFTFQGSGTLNLRSPLTDTDLSRFNQLCLTVENRCEAPLLVGIRLIHTAKGLAPDQPAVSFSGGREELPPRAARRINFPRESLGFYGWPQGWADISALELAFAVERGYAGPKDIEAAVCSLEGEVRILPQGPRLTPHGLRAVLGEGVHRGSVSSVTAIAENTGPLRGCIPPYVPSDSGLFIPPPHPYPREGADRILNGHIMGQVLPVPLQWDANPLGVQEWTHFLNRHHFMRELTISLVQTGEERYAKALDQLISSWITENPPPVDSNGGAGPGWETLSVAWRLREWLWVWGIGWDYLGFSQETRLLMLRSIWEHAQTLMDHRGHPNNWIIVESAALALAGICFPGFRDAEQWRETGIERLRVEIGRQFFEDGVHFEISPLYHAICFHALLDVKQAAAAKGLKLPDEFGPLLERCADYLLGLCRPDFTWPSLNDSGSADTDHTALMKKAGQLLSRPDCLWIGSRGAEGTIPQRTFHVFPHAGVASMRSHYGQDANFLVFRAGPAGAAHVHEDTLSLDVTALGIPRLVDPGITMYAPDTLTDHYRSAAAHTMVLVDGVGPGRSTREFHERISPAGQDFTSTSTESVDMVTGTCRGSWGPGTELTAMRTAIFIKPRYWLILDRISGTGGHELTWCWQFFPGRVEVDRNDLALRCVDLRGPGFEVIPLRDREGMEIDLQAGSLSPCRGWVSMGGRDVPAFTCRYAISASLPHKQAWVLMPHSRGQVSGVHASLKEEEDGTLTFEVSFPEGSTDLITLASDGKLDRTTISQKRP